MSMSKYKVPVVVQVDTENQVPPAAILKELLAWSVLDQYQYM
jgi:hypothetical protein